MKNYFLISLVFVIFSMLNAVTASFVRTIPLYSPIKSISFYSENSANSQEVINGGNVVIRAVADKELNVQTISFAGKTLEYDMACSGTDCFYDFKINAQNDFTPSAILKIDFYDNSSKELKSISLTNLPIRKIESTDYLSDLISINFYKTSQANSTIVTNNDSLTFEMISYRADFKSFIQSLELLGTAINIENIQQEPFNVNGELFYKFYITVAVPANYTKKDFNFNLKIKNNQGKILNFNDSNYFSSIKILNGSSSLDPSVKLEVSSSRENNSITASSDDQFTISINTSEPSIDISNVSINGTDLMKNMKATCSGNNCSYVFKYTPPVQSSDISLRDLNLIYSNENSQCDNHSNLITVRDYQQVNSLSRLTFGINNEMNTDILQNGKEAFINKQLSPSSIDNSAFINNLQDYRLLANDNSGNNVRAWVAKFFLLSKTQFQERLGYFWMNHFNTALFDGAKIINIRSWKTSKLSDFSFRELKNAGYSLTNDVPEASFFIDHSQLPNLVNLKDYDKLNLIVTYKPVSGVPSSIAKVIIEGKNASNVATTVTMTTPAIVLDDIKKIITLDIPDEARQLAQITKISFFPSNVANVPILLNGIELSGANGLSKFLFASATILSARDYLFFRENALGNFKKLLLYSARSQNMIVYLDVILNSKNSINENYAREILELHTVGIKANYTNDDVNKLSKFFTGIDIFGEYFFLNSANHLNGNLNLSIFPNSFPGNNQADLEAFLSALGDHPSTAKYICTKLLKVLVSEEPLESSIQACADVFLQNKNSEYQIRDVVKFIINSPEFSSKSNFENKISNPLVYYSHFYRSLNTVNLNSRREFSGLIASVDYNLLANTVPTGYEEIGLLWFNGNVLNKGVTNISSFLVNTHTSDADIFSLIDNNLTTYNADTIAAFILTRFASSSFTQEEFNQIKSLLGTNFVYTKTTDVANKIRDAIYVTKLCPAAQKN